MSVWLERWLDVTDVELVVLPCRQRTWLFFSTDPASQRAAVKLCRACPVILACRQRCDELEADTNVPPAGIWAAETPGQRTRRRTARTVPADRNP